MNCNIADIINAIKPVKLLGPAIGEVSGICIDSRKVQPDWLYAAMPGTTTDGHLYINTAIEKGARYILCTEVKEQNPEITYLVVQDVPQALGMACRVFYNHPTSQIRLVGTTGTNGKTTISTLLFDLFTNMGYKCGLISTVENRIGETVVPSTHTTPDCVGLNELLHQMLEEGCDYCFMECSSHAIHQQRIAGLEFAGGIFTNITHDHLDYHETFDNYRYAKKAFFDQLPATAFALTNKDDRNGMFMLQNTKASRYTYAMKNGADFTVKVMESDFAGMQLQIAGKDMWVGLVGEFNAYNIAAVYGAAFLLTEGDETLPVRLSSLARVNGRFEAIAGPDRKTAIVDYAHTPDALENVIRTINQIRGNSARLITVVGCGGDRDETKRPEMGAIAARLSDRAIFTSDNPRSENPDDIINQMEKGVEGQYYKKILKITDRREAIKAAALMAEAGDVILIAGKGHETYQEIKGVKHPFDDKRTIHELFTTLK